MNKNTQQRPIADDPYKNTQTHTVISYYKITPNGFFGEKKKVVTDWLR